MPLTKSQTQQIAALALSPAGLGVIATNGKYELPAHIRLLNKALLDVSARRSKRLMVFTPPRHGKSTTTSQFFPAWYLGTHPDERLILTSYEADFAASWGRKSRDVLTEWGPLLYGVSVSENSSAANRWDIAGHAGGMTTAGVGGPITGRGANLFIIDDPVKNAEEALSTVRRQHIKDWWLSTAYTRLEPNGAVILTMTRWHDDDLAGWLLTEGSAEDDEPWTVISLPALAEEDDRLGRAVGEALWPERYSTERLQQIRATLGTSYWWQALYQQRPSPESGTVYQRAWFDKRFRDVPSTRLGSVLAVDSAFKEGTGSDYSALAYWTTDGLNYYLSHAWRGRVPFPDLLRVIVDTYWRYRPDAVLIEDAASGQSAIQQLRRDTNLPIIGVPAKGSKVSRAEAVTPLFEAGKVSLPESRAAPWLAEWIDEHIRFPRAAHDDQVDTTSHALAYLKNHYVGGDVVLVTTRYHEQLYETPMQALAREQQEAAAERLVELQRQIDHPLLDEIAEQLVDAGVLSLDDVQAAPRSRVGQRQATKRTAPAPTEQDQQQAHLREMLNQLVSSRINDGFAGSR